MSSIKSHKWENSQASSWSVMTAAVFSIQRPGWAAGQGFCGVWLRFHCRNSFQPDVCPVDYLWGAMLSKEARLHLSHHIWMKRARGYAKRPRREFRLASAAVAAAVRHTIHSNIWAYCHVSERVCVWPPVFVRKHQVKTITEMRALSSWSQVFYSLALLMIIF